LREKNQAFEKQNRAFDLTQALPMFCFAGEMKNQKKKRKTFVVFCLNFKLCVEAKTLNEIIQISTQFLLLSAF